MDLIALQTMTRNIPPDSVGETLHFTRGTRESTGTRVRRPKRR